MFIWLFWQNCLWVCEVHALWSEKKRIIFFKPKNSKKLKQSLIEVKTLPRLGQQRSHIWTRARDEFVLFSNIGVNSCPKNSLLNPTKKYVCPVWDNSCRPALPCFHCVKISQVAPWRPCILPCEPSSPSSDTPCLHHALVKSTTVIG